MLGINLTPRRATGAALLTTLLTTTTAQARDPLAAAPLAPSGAGPASMATAVDAPTDGYRRWHDERRKLRVQVGVSAGLAAAFLAAGVLALTVPACNPPPGAPSDHCGMPLGRFMVSGALLSAAAVTTVPAVVFGVRLGRHQRQRPVALHVAPGGLALRF